MLSEIYPGSSPQMGSSYWDQIQEVAIISVTRRVLQHLHDLVEQVSFSMPLHNLSSFWCNLGLIYLVDLMLSI